MYRRFQNRRTVRAEFAKIYDAIPLLQSGEVDQLINEASKDDVVAFND